MSMGRVFISYSGHDSDAAMFLANQLRMHDIDVFIDYQRLMDGVQFTRRLENEINTRKVVIFVQSPEALQSPLVQTEIEFAYTSGAKIIPVALKPLNVRDTGEFRFLLHLKAIDFKDWKNTQIGRRAITQIKERLNDNESAQARITAENAKHLTDSVVLYTHEGWVRTVVFSPDGNLMATSANDDTICLWDMRHRSIQNASPKLLTTVRELKSLAWGLAFAPRHALLASAGADSTMRFWDLNTIPNMYEFSKLNGYTEQVFGVAFSADGQLLATANQDNCARVHDITNLDKTGRARATIELLHAGQVYWVDFSPDSRILASTSRDSAVRLWELSDDMFGSRRTLKPITLKGHKSWVNSATFAPHGLILASASDDHTVRLWDVENREVIAVLEGHKEGVNTIAFSSDGSLLASASKDGTVRIWDLVSLKTVVTLIGHEGRVNTVAFAPDSTVLVSGGGDHTVRLWRVS